MYKNLMHNLGMVVMTKNVSLEVILSILSAVLVLVLFLFLGKRFFTSKCKNIF